MKFGKKKKKDTSESIAAARETSLTERTRRTGEIDSGVCRFVLLCQVLSTLGLEDYLGYQDGPLEDH